MKDVMGEEVIEITFSDIPDYGDLLTLADFIGRALQYIV